MTYDVIGQAKAWLIALTGATNDVLHIYCGVSIQLGLCLLLGVGLRSPTPLYFVCALELFNEINDILAAAHFIDADFIHNFVVDFANSVIIPTGLFLSARFTMMLNPTPDNRYQPIVPMGVGNSKD